MSSHMNCSCCGQPVEIIYGIKKIICVECRATGRDFNEIEARDDVD